MVDECETWCRNLAACGRDGRAIVLTGPFGCGKTHAMRASSRYVRDVRMSIWPEPWAYPLTAMRVEWATVVREVCENDNRDYCDDLLAADVAFIDDIGCEEDRYKSGSPARVLGDVLGALHDKRRFVFLTTNIGPEGWASRWDGRVNDRLWRLNARIVDLWGDGAQSFAAWSALNSADNVARK